MKVFRELSHDVGENEKIEGIKRPGEETCDEGVARVGPLAAGGPAAHRGCIVACGR